jgi:membrane protein DedA with SNARE-associated domain
MRERWLRIGILAGALIAVNVVGRLVVQLGSVDDVETQELVTLVTYGAVALVMAVVAGWWVRLRPLGVVVADLAGGAVAAGLLTLLVGPFVSGTSPSAVGVGDSFEAAWQFAGFAAAGALVGMLLVIMLGRDHQSKSLKRFAEAKLTKPRRPV